MGCCIGCFRTKDSNANLVTPSKPAAPCSKNALSSLFLTDDESVLKGEKGKNQLPEELHVRELKNEAKFLKPCGILPETPVKIQNTLEKSEGTSAPEGAEKSSKFNTWLQNTSIEKMKLENQSDESPAPVKICEEWVTGSGSFLDSPSSCMTDGHNTERASSSSIRRSVCNINTPKVMCDSEACSEISSASTQVYATSAQCKKKYVSFDYEPDRPALSSKGYSSECVSPHTNQSVSTGMGSVTNPSPYPTPTIFTQEMRTRDTLFPGSHHVYSVLENTSQGNELKDDSSDSHPSSEPVKLNKEGSLMSTLVSDLSAKEVMKDETVVSSWLKPLSTKQGDNKRFSEIVYRRKIPLDRPILGMVAAHWNDEETSHISPKWWDGNGIPNSTNKYKEDQKVSWHATPFEERLEKALSEETSISQRKPISRTRPLVLNETEECDTALSHLQSSAHVKSVVSF